MVDPCLLKAFRSTRFIVFHQDGDIVLRVGLRNQELDNLLARFEAKGCAFITAWNPGGVRLSEAQNQTRQAKLIAEIQQRSLPFLHGRGVGEDENWPPENSILVIGINRIEAIAVGRLFGQIAVVFAERGRAVKLLLCN